MKDHTTDIIIPEPEATLHSLFLERVRRSPQAVAYSSWDKRADKWQDLSWWDMAIKVAQWREAILSEKLEVNSRVALMLPNGPDWICFEQAALSMGLVVVPLYANDRAENIAYILEQTDTKILLCPGLEYWEHLAPVIDRLKHIQRIVTIDACVSVHMDERILCITDWLPSNFEQDYHYQLSTNELATIVYTSGTTGPPKGVMLTHRNILSNCYAGLHAIPVYPTDNFLSFLPVSHMLERTVGYYVPMMAGASVTFARSIPQLAEDLKQVKPTVLVAVPRIFERIHAAISEKVEKKSLFSRKLFQAAIDFGWLSYLDHQYRIAYNPRLLLAPFLDMLVARKVRQKFGGRLRVIISGGAPLSSTIARFFIGLGFPLLQGYGLTETSPVVSVNRIGDNRPDGVGLPLPGIEVKIGKDQELMVKGDCIMQGYWNNREAYLETVDRDGWLKTGDKAEIIDGHITITGRIKDVIVLSNSEKVSPADMEMAIAVDPLFETAMVVGEDRPYLTLLAVVNREKMKSIFNTLKLGDDNEDLHNPQVLQAVLLRIEKQLTKFPGFAWIKKVSLSYEPWSVENGLLTPTLKVKRKRILQKMKKEIDAMYDAA